MISDLVLPLVLLLVVVGGAFLAYRYRSASSGGGSGGPSGGPTVPLEADVLSFAAKYSVADAAKRFDLSLKTVKRLRVLSGAEPKTCGSCEHFDVSKGQTMLANHNVMAAVARALSPGQITQDPELAQTWADIGACLMRPGTGIGSGDWCGNAVHEGKLKPAGDLWS